MDVLIVEDVTLVGRVNIALFEGDAVDNDRCVIDSNSIARYADDTFDIIQVGVRWSDKDDHISTLGWVEQVRPFVYQDEFGIVQTGFHAGAFDVEVLHGKANDQKHEDGEDDRFDHLTHQAIFFFKIKFWFHASPPGESG